MHTQQPILTILHFNDIYDIQQRNNKGGIVNFKHKIQTLRQKYPNSILLLSGDALSPSILSSINQGWQMVHSLNTLNIDAACYGNHQFDFQYQHLIKLKNACNFTWLLGNIKYIPTGNLLGQGKQYIILHKFGLKIGIFGIAGPDWPGILPQMYQNKIQYIDHIQYSTHLTKKLRYQLHCDIIISLTHMRNSPDCMYPSYIKQVDLVLGGHDHVILTQIIDNVPVIKSGTNFMNIGIVNVYAHQNQNHGYQKQHQIGRRFYFQFKIIDVEKVNDDVVENDENLKKLKDYVNGLMLEYKKFDKMVGYTDIQLDTRFQFHRRHQSTYGNFMADLFRLYTNSDIALYNSGNIRNDMLLPKGQLWFSYVQNVIDDSLVVKKLTGKQILTALQMSIDSLPKGTKGSFLQVSGLKFTYETKRPIGSRVVRVNVGRERLNKEKEYSVVFIGYVAKGGDNYGFIKQCETLKDQAETITTTNLVKQFFQNLNYSLLPQKQRQQYLSTLPPQSQPTKRIVTLQTRLIYHKQYKKYLPVICPQIQDRIEQIFNTTKLFLTLQRLKSAVYDEKEEDDIYSSTSLDGELEMLKVKKSKSVKEIGMGKQEQSL